MHDEPVCGCVVSHVPVQACSNAIEVLHSLVSTDACAEEVSRDHSGVVQLLGTLLQDGAVRLTQPGWTRVRTTQHKTRVCVRACVRAYVCVCVQLAWDSVL